MTPDERKLGLLAFSAMTVCGTLAYEGARSIREGNLLLTERQAESSSGGVATFVFAALGVGLTLKAMGELADEVGAEPLALGSVAIFAMGSVLKANRR